MQFLYLGIIIIHEMTTVWDWLLSVLKSISDTYVIFICTEQLLLISHLMNYVHAVTTHSMHIQVLYVLEIKHLRKPLNPSSAQHPAFPRMDVNRTKMLNVCPCNVDKNRSEQMRRDTVTSTEQYRIFNFSPRTTLKARLSVQTVSAKYVRNNFSPEVVPDVISRKNNFSKVHAVRIARFVRRPRWTNNSQ